MGAVHVDVDRRDLGAAFLARADRVRHHIDLGIDRIGAPDHHQVGLRHLARIDAGNAADAGGKAGIGRIDADGGMEAGIFLDVAKPVDAVAHDQAHGVGVVIGPHALRAVALLGRDEFFRHEVERVVPGGRAELAGALVADALQRMQQALRMMLPLGITCDLGADDAGGVVVVLGAVHAADGALVKQFDFERAGRRAVVRAGRSADAICREPDGLVHGSNIPVIPDAAKRPSGIQKQIQTSPLDSGFARLRWAPRNDVGRLALQLHFLSTSLHGSP
jgi:hypothetical protein